MAGVSTGFRGKGGTRHRMLEINAAPCSPETLAPSVTTVETRLLTDLRKFSSASAISVDPVLNPPCPARSSDTELWCWARSQYALALA